MKPTVTVASAAPTHLTWGNRSGSPPDACTARRDRSRYRPADPATLLKIPRFDRRVLAVGRHELASSRRTSSVLVAAVISPVAVLLATGGDVRSVAAGRDADRAADDVVSCCVEVVAAPVPHWADPPNAPISMNSVPGRFISASRFRVVQRDIQRALPAGVAPERGLQVRTILVARSISAVFPEIHEIGGVRPDALRWHPNGLALDVMIPNPGTVHGIALGNQIVAFVMKNAARFGIQDAIWRGTYYTPRGPRGYGAGHYDHVHVTTTGGGYPTGAETYFR